MAEILQSAQKIPDLWDINVEEDIVKRLAHSVLVMPQRNVCPMTIISLTLQLVSISTVDVTLYSKQDTQR